MTSGWPDYWLQGKLIELIQTINLVDRVTLIDTISTIASITGITNIANVESVDLIDAITLIDDITNIANIESVDLIDLITAISSITNVVNVESIDLIDAITLIDDITTVGTITSVTDIVNLQSVDLIDKITLIDDITDIANIASVDLIDRITLIDDITTIGTIDTITTITNIGDNVQPRPLSSRRRTGRAFHVDTFESYYSAVTEKWEQNTGTIALSTDYAKSGSASMKLTTGTAANNYAYAILYVGPFAVGKFGMEFDFMTLEAVANIREIGLEIYYYDGDELHAGKIAWLGETNKKLQYLNSSNNLADISGGDYSLMLAAETGLTTSPVWHNIKLIIDVENDLYDTLWLNEKTYDLSALALYVPTVSHAPSLECYIYIRNATSTAGRDLYVDNVILTDQE